MKTTKLIRAFLAAVLTVGVMSASYALSVDQTRIINKRQYQDYHPVFYRVTVNYNDKNIGSGQQFAELTQNDFIQAIDCHVTTAFNAGTTNVVTFGTTASTADIVGASGANASITAGTPGIYHLTAALGLGLAATTPSDEPLYAKYAQTGTAATAGSVTCVFTVVPNNDN